MSQILRASNESENVQPDAMGIVEFNKLNYLLSMEKLIGMPPLEPFYRNGNWNVFRYDAQWVEWLNAHNVGYWLFTRGYEYEQDRLSYQRSKAAVEGR